MQQHQSEDLIKPSASMPSSAGTKAEDDDDGEYRKRRPASPASTCCTHTSSAASETNSPSTATINLRREYTLAVQTNSYNEMWAMTHRQNEQGEVLRPDRESIEEAIRLARPTRLTRVVSRYLESSEQASRIFLSLRRSVDIAREIYAPIASLLDVLPAFSPPSLSLLQCDGAFDAFLDFHHRENPFPSAADCFVDIRDCFSVLKQQLESRLVAARRRHRLLRRTTIASATCLVVTVAGAATAALVLAAHTLLAAAVMWPAVFCCDDALAGRRQRLRDLMAETDAATRETYVLDNNLSTVERLVSRLHATVESDKLLVRLGLERGRGQIHPIQEVMRQLRKNHSSFQHQLKDLDEHVCLCLAAVNRARHLLLQQINRL